MKILILIPSTPLPAMTYYGIWVLVVLSLGSFTIARHIHIRWLYQKYSLVGANAIVKMLLAVFGSLLIPWQQLFSLHWYQESTGLLWGVGLAYLVIWCEMKMIRRVNRKKLYSHQGQQLNTLEANKNTPKSTIKTILSLSTKAKLTQRGLTQVRKAYRLYAEEANFLNYSLIAAVIVAIAEEILFRGYLISLAMRMENHFLMVIIILCSVTIFACSHLSNHWHEVTCKIPLSLATTIAFIATGTLLTAITIHVLLNWYAYQYRETWMRSAEKAQKN